MYFCVKKPLKIGSKSFKPCIGYNLADYLVTTIRKLEAEGDAEISDTPIFFQNGKKIEKTAVEKPDFAEKLQKTVEKDKKTEVKNKKKDVKKAETEPVSVDEFIPSEDDNGGF